MLFARSNLLLNEGIASLSWCGLDTDFVLLDQRLSLQRPIFHPMWSQILAKFFNHHGFVIGPVAEVHLCNRIPFKDDEAGVDTTEEGGAVTSLIAFI